MSEHIPAWKRIGLKVKQELEVDPLDVTTHLDSGKITAKQTKLLNKKKRASATVNDGEKKPPKRQKLPKSERPPPPEKDQLVYLKTYTTDRENWKFSKQKQNWILKHIKIIEDKYEDYLVNYLGGLQGGSKDRLVESMKTVVESWNKAALEDTTKNEESGESKESEVKKEEKNDLESVDSDYAIRARKIVKAITEEDLKLTGIDDQEKEIESEESKSESSEESKSTSDSEESTETSNESQSSNSSSSSSSSSKGSEDEKTPEPKVPDTSNLIIEQVEVTDFLNEEDYMDPLPEVQTSAEKIEEEEETASEESLKKEKSKKEKKAKKEKKEKKDKKKEKKEKKSTK